MSWCRWRPLEQTFTFIRITLCEHIKKNDHAVCGADNFMKLQLDVTLGNFGTFVCYASIIVNEKLHTSIVTIKSFQLGVVFVECIVRCKQLSIKLLDEDVPVSLSVCHLRQHRGRSVPSTSPVMVAVSITFAVEWKRLQVEDQRARLFILKWNMPIFHFCYPVNWHETKCVQSFIQRMSCSK